MLRFQLLLVALIVVAIGCVAAFNTPVVFYYWPAVRIDPEQLPARADVLVPPGVLNFKMSPLDQAHEPQWPTTLSWRLLDAQDHVIFVGATNVETAEDLGWRRPLAMRDLSFGDGHWLSPRRLKPAGVYRLEVLSARRSAERTSNGFVIDMYYAAPIRLYDKLTCYGLCARRRDPASVPAAPPAQ